MIRNKKGQYNDAALMSISVLKKMDELTRQLTSQTQRYQTQIDDYKDPFQKIINV